MFRMMLRIFRTALNKTALNKTALNINKLIVQSVGATFSLALMKLNEWMRSEGVQRKLARPLALFLIALFVLGLSIWPSFAAVELLESFRVESYVDQLHLSWVTKSEYNISSFEVLCKDADAPDTSYHVIQIHSRLQIFIKSI